MEGCTKEDPIYVYYIVEFTNYINLTVVESGKEVFFNSFCLHNACF